MAEIYRRAMQCDKLLSDSHLSPKREVTPSPHYWYTSKQFIVHFTDRETEAETPGALSVILKSCGSLFPVYLLSH